MNNMEHKTLNNGLKMPMVGLGVYNIPEKETQRVMEDALSVGYRSIDTAAMYENEKGVGDAVRACNVPREELFVTTKICEPCYTREETLRTVDQSMRQIGLDYVDLMLLHWPVGNPTVMWHTLEELYAQGMFKAIGVSNFYPNTFPSPSENSFQPACGCCVHRGSCVVGTVTMIHHAGCLVSMARQGSAFCGSPSMHGMSQKAEKPFKKA